MRYGSIPNGYKKSMTHLEYDEAQRVNLLITPRICDVKSDTNHTSEAA
jgi:hypothetical protein